MIRLLRRCRWTLGSYDLLLARNGAGHAIALRHLAKGFNQEDNKDRKAVTKNIDLEMKFAHFLRGCFVFLALSSLNELPPHSDPWSGSNHWMLV